MRPEDPTTAVSSPVSAADWDPLCTPGDEAFTPERGPNNRAASREAAE